MKCPYSELDMKLTALSINEEHVKKLEELKPEMEAIGSDIPTKEDLNKAVAKDNGITVDQLINSPNMAYMTEVFVAKKLEKLIEFLTANGFSHKQAWAMTMSAMGAMDE